jgi:hypothetical protein
LFFESAENESPHLLRINSRPIVDFSQIDGLEKLTRLQKLELGKNRTASCEKLCTLTGLTQLSLEVGLTQYLLPTEHD